jgi:hypothetical protein
VAAAGNSGLGWEFQFLVTILGTPIRSKIPTPFQIPGIPVRFFFRIPLLKSHQIRIPTPKFRIPVFFHVGAQYISFRTYRPRSTSEITRNIFSCCNYIYLLFLVDVILAGKIIMPPKLHLLKTSRCHFSGKIIMSPKLHLLILLGKWVDVILAGKIIILPSNLHLFKMSRWILGGKLILLPKITSTCFTWKISRCNFGGQNTKWWDFFPVHEIGRIYGGTIF